MKTKICYFIQDFKIGGAEKLIVELIKWLPKEQFEIFIITLSKSGFLFKNIPFGIKTYTEKNPFKIYTILKDENPLIFHSHLWRADFIGIPLAKLAGIKTIISTKHNVNYFTGLKKMLIPFDALVLKLTNNVIAISDAVKLFYESNKLYTNINFVKIYNGIDFTSFECSNVLKQENNNGKINLLTVANLTQQKGHLQFLEILKDMNDLNFEWHLVGDGPLIYRLREKVKEFNLEKKVIFHGKQINVQTYYAKADIFILPSLWEGFGLVLLEAMNLKVPVFASNVDGVKEILKDNETAVLFDWNRKEEIKPRLKELIVNKGLQENIKENAYQEVKRFSIEKMVTNYEKLYLKNN